MMSQQPPDNILIVDDEPDIALILKLHLEEAGYLTSWAADGESGLSLLHSNGFDLVLLDIRMPGINGVEVLHRLRSDSIDPAVIMMTAHGNESLAVDCMKAGAVDYVAKPFDIDDLLLRIKRAIDSRRILNEKRFLEQEKEDFIFMLSHDMKNPITAAIGSIDIMREGRLGPVNPDQIDYLQAAIESCEEVVIMIDNLLDIQRFNTGKMQTRSAPVNLVTLLGDAVRRFAPAAERENIILTLDTQSGIHEIATDGSILARVIANLIGNALKFTHEGGTITLSCRYFEKCELSQVGIPSHVAVPEGFSEFNRFLKISVRDTGSGISPDDLTKIFDRYVQVGSGSQRSRGGAGLGLAFCKKAVADFKGCIWAESGGESGSEFIILLPCNFTDQKCTEAGPEA